MCVCVCVVKDSIDELNKKAYTYLYGYTYCGGGYTIGFHV